ncbi:hypothetical protein [Rhizobium oryzicola]|uniref:Uncharacterized protein n=1 Tax=Rhizobium oryzicola TaxID=1232668 RepID=A0ABT8STT5_9HYPH|nr:hypothetical protein [Rhizobium oryzicola]MDO1581845.1 hypothetical protein [Rhizobium oryzicola]
MYDRLDRLSLAQHLAQKEARRWQQPFEPAVRSQPGLSVFLRLLALMGLGGLALIGIASASWV